MGIFFNVGIGLSRQSGINPHSGTPWVAELDRKKTIFWENDISKKFVDIWVVYLRELC